MKKVVRKLSKKKMPGRVGVNRDAKIGCLPFREVFTGFEDVDAVRAIFLEGPRRSWRASWWTSSRGKVT